MMKMKVLFFCTGVLVACAIQGTRAVPDEAEAETLTNTIWMHLNGDWQHPPSDENTPDYRSAPATLLRFSKANQFSMIGCWISEFKGKLAISNGDGQAIHVGVWSRGDQGTIVARHRLVYEMVRPVGGGEYPGPEKQETALLAGGAVRFRDQLFTPAEGLSFGEYERFVDANGSRLKIR